MKSISASIVIASGAALQIGACNAEWNRESTWNIGVILMLLGIAAWVYVQKTDK